MFVKKLLLSVVLLLSLSANAGVFVSPEEAAATVATKCANGCAILSAEQIAQIQAQVESIAMQAYNAGRADGLELAKDNPKICPKDI